MTLMSQIFIELLPSNSDDVKTTTTTTTNKKAGPRRLALAQPQKRIGQNRTKIKTKKNCFRLMQ